MPKLLKSAISLQYLKKEVNDEVNFCWQISMKASYKLILSFLMGMVKHSQNFQNYTFARSLQDLKKEVRDEVDFLLAGKHQSFLQVDFNTLGIKVLTK